MSHRACLQCVHHLGSQMRKHISIDNKKCCKIKSIIFVCWNMHVRPYKNQKQRKENNHKLNRNNNISSKYNQSTMFPVKRKCDTWFSLCPFHLHLKTMLSCFGSLKVAFHWDYIHSHYWTTSVHQYNKKNPKRKHKASHLRRVSLHTINQ